MTELSENLMALVDDVPTPFFLLGCDESDILWANHAAQEWLGYSLHSIEGKQLESYITEFDAIGTAIHRVKSEQSPVSLRHFIIKRDGSNQQRCHLTIYPTNNHLGLVIQIGGAQPNDAKLGGHAVSAMGRMIAHELKNPLAGIKGAAQLLLDDVDTDEGKGLIGLIGSEIDRIRRLADRMETLGDQDPDNDEKVNIHEILRRARTVVQSAKPDKLRFTEHYDPSLPLAYGDSDTLMQAVLNLIMNAAEAIETSGEGDEIRLETSFRAGVKRRIEGESERRQLPIDIRIIDNGPGISEGIRSQVFQPFVTNKPTGQGLGLALVSKVAAAHGGLVEVRSRPGHTVFSLLLPTPEEDM